MALSIDDARAIASTANRLGVDPRSLGALMELESSLDPNIWGGSGGKYRGLIQFGPEARREVGLPDRSMTIAEQMPYVERYFGQRGFTPGRHGTTELYRTVLVGNPGQSGTDSFGTNSDAAARRMMPGGDLYQRFSDKFDRAAGSGAEVGGGLSDSTAMAALGGFGRQDSSIDLGLSGLGIPVPQDMSDPVQALSRALQTNGPASRDGVALLSGLAAIPTLSAINPEMARSVGSRLKQQLEQRNADQLLTNAYALTAPRMAGMGSRQNVFDLAGRESRLESTNALDQLISGEAQSRAGAIQGVQAGGSSLPLLEVGRRLQAAGLRVREHPEFGGVGRHSPNSLHYKGLAMDLTDWQDPGESESSWLPRKKFLGQQIEGILGDRGEIFHPGNDPQGHPTHIHFGVPSGRLDSNTVEAIVQARQEALRRFPLRWAG